MDTVVLGGTVHYAEHGAGLPVLALHGAGVDHREIAGALEPAFTELPGFRRLYPDLPGMGHTAAPESVASNDDVVDVLLGVIDNLIGDEKFLVIGHSYGAYLARAIAYRRASQAAGLALICPVGDRAGQVPQHEVLVSSPELTSELDADEAESYSSYFVVQTRETLRRFQERVAPSSRLADESSLMRIFSRWQLKDNFEAAEPDSRPTLILAGRQDATAGYAGAWELLDFYPRATFAVLDSAGHALLHEQPQLAQAFIIEWLSRAREATSV